MTTAVAAQRYPDIHLLLYGESGAGKSTFWASLIKYHYENFGEPSLVFQFDPYGKATPYTELGEVQENKHEFYAGLGIEVDDVIGPDGKLICQVEYYAEPIPDDPQAISRFEKRMVGFEQQARNWASICVDSMTFFQRASFQKWKKLNPLAPDNFKQQTNLSWYGGVKEDGANLLMSRTIWWRTNVGVICHVAKDKEEFADLGAIKGVALVGQLAKDAPAGFDEVHRLRIVPDKSGKGEHKRELQTRSDSMWNANSLVTKAPNPCAPDYQALWANWKGRK